VDCIQLVSGKETGNKLEVGNKLTIIGTGMSQKMGDSGNLNPVHAMFIFIGVRCAGSGG